MVLIVTVDPSLDTEPDASAPCPSGVAPITIAVDRAEMLVGRHDEKRDIHPEVSVHDPGASRRHAKFVVLADGQVALQDLASMNGTSVNGEVVASGSRRTLAPGDAVTLGRWTRITLREAP
jgi:pSer/pThr/pTyr-binding forkhead associated (FHA) protein